MEQAQELTEIRAELHRLKRQNRRVAVLGAAFVGGCALVSLIGAAQRQAPPKSITALKFILVDSAGKQRAVLTTTPEGAALDLFRADGLTIADVLGEGGAFGNGLNIFGTAGLGGPRASMTVGMLPSEYTGTPRPPGTTDSEWTAMTAASVRPFIGLADAAGNDRLALTLRSGGGNAADQDAELWFADSQQKTQLKAFGLLDDTSNQHVKSGVPKAFIQVEETGGSEVDLPPLAREGQVAAGSLCIESHLASTTAFLDGRPIGNTPVEVTIPAGEHAIELHAPAQGYTDGAQPAPWKTTVEVLQGGKQLVDGYYSDHFPASAPACPDRN